MELMRRRRGIMGLNGGAGIPVITATASGNPLSFVTDMVRPLKSLVIPFTPIQAAGTPSLDNPLPISGWTGANISKSGVNLFPAGLELTQGSLNAAGTVVVSSPNAVCRLDPIPVDAETTYTLSSNIVRSLVKFFDDSKTKISETSWKNNYKNTFTTPSGCKYINFILNDTAVEITPETVERLQLEFGTDVTAYSEPLGITTLSINWQDKAGTIYGGTPTLHEDVNADLVREYGMKPISDWKYYTIRTQNPTSGWDSFQLYLPSDDIKQAGGSVVDGKPNIWSTIFQARTNAEIADNPGYSIRKADGYIYLSVPADTYTSWNDFKTAFGDIPIVYPLATPQTYHFDNIGQLITFVGTNNIWTDTNGTNTATYLKHQS